MQHISAVHQLFAVFLLAHGVISAYIAPMAQHPSTQPWWAIADGVFQFRGTISNTQPLTLAISSSRQTTSADTYIEVKLAATPGQGAVTFTTGANTTVMAASDCQFFNTPRNVGAADDYWVIYRNGVTIGTTISVGVGPTPGHGTFYLTCNQPAFVTSKLQPLRGSNIVMRYLHVSGLHGGVRTNTAWFGSKSGVFVSAQKAPSAAGAELAANSLGVGGTVISTEPGPLIKLVDINGDGMRDLYIHTHQPPLTFGQPNTAFFINQYLKTGTPTSSSYTAQNADFLAGACAQPGGFGVIAFPAFADMNGDGLFDVVCPRPSGTASVASPIRVVYNTGTPSAPTWSAVDTGFSLFGLEPFVLALDLDGDGDFDLLADNETYTSKTYLENVGSAAAPSFRVVPPSRWPAFVSTVPYDRAANVVDMDGDGDYDVATLGPDSRRALRYYENRGNATHANLVRTFGVGNPFGDVTPTRKILPSLADFDLDGDIDLAFGDDITHQVGATNYYQNVGFRYAPAVTRRTAPSLNLMAPVEAALAGAAVAATTMADLDGDGDADALVALQDGTFRYFRNDGSQTSPSFASAAVPAGLTPQGSLPQIPTCVDLDGDGDLDISAGVFDPAATGGGIGSGAYSFNYYENVGNTSVPLFARRTGAANPVNIVYGPPSSVIASTGQAFGDVDGDGDYDILMNANAGNYGYTMAIFRNTGTASAPVFDKTAGTVGFGGPSANVWQPVLYYSDPGKNFVDFVTHPRFVDQNGDGKLDIAISGKGVLLWYENTGSATASSYAVTTARAFGPSASSAATSTAGCQPVTSAVDLNGDGDMDYVISCGSSINYVGSTVIQCSDACNSNGACLQTKTDEVGQCSCFSGFFGARCNSLCQFSADGQVCSGFGACYSGSKAALLGQCFCTVGYAGTKCGTCANGYWNYPTCTPCASNCNGRGFCNVTDGACVCNPGYSGSDCQVGGCAPGYGIAGASCAACAPGTSKNVVGDTVCGKCAVGSHQPLWGQTTCKLCPLNSQSHELRRSCICDRGYITVPATASGNTTEISCVACPPGFDCNKPGLLIPELTPLKGWWFKPAPASNVIPTAYECPFPDSCSMQSPATAVVGGSGGSGGNVSLQLVNSSQICTTGYSGVVCAVCAPDYYLTDAGCLRCQRSGILGPIAVGVVGLLVLATCVMRRGRDGTLATLQAAKARKEALEKRKADLIADAQVRALDTAEAAAERDRQQRTHKHKAALFGLIAIFVSFAQVMGSMSGVFSIPWPQFYTDASAWLSSFLGDFFSRTGTSCFSSSYNFFSSMQLMTVSPFAAWALMALALLYVNHSQGEEADKLAKRNKLFYFASTLMTLVYPAMSVKAFRTFMCSDVNGVLYLEADYTIRCFSPAHNQHIIWAAIVVVTISAGWPLFLAAFLTHLRRKGLLQDEQILARYGHLYTSYEPRWYYWEALESVRKLFLTSIIVFFGKGTMLQVVLGCFVAFIAHLAHALTNPYVNDSADELQHSALGAIWLTLFGGIIAYMPRLTQTESAVLGGLALVVQYSVIGFSVFKTFVEFRKKLTELRQRSADQKAKASAVVDGGEEGTKEDEVGIEMVAAAADDDDDD